MTVGVSEVKPPLHRVKQRVIDAVRGGREKVGRLVNSMLDEVASCDASAQFTVERLGVESFEQGFLCSDHRTLDFKEFSFQEDGVNPTGVQRYGMGGRLEGIPLVALLLSEKTRLEGPCLTALTVEGEAALIGFQGEFVLTFSFQQLSVVQPVGRSTGVRLKRLQNRLNGFGAGPGSRT